MSFVNPDAYLPDYPDGFPMSAEEVVEDLRARLVECERLKQERDEALERIPRWMRDADTRAVLALEAENAKLRKVAEEAKRLMLSTPADHSGDALCAALAELDKVLEKC